MKSLFIGRYQPFHKGHKALIDKVLKEGKKVVVAIRDTGLSGSNPYTLEERKKMINDIYGKKVEVITIPDVMEICYGRKVGYDIRRIRVSKFIENISSTKIRKSQKRIIWLTGNVASGKTSLAYLLKERLNAVVLDGDEMRQSISQGAGYGKRDRHQHNLRVARLANVLNSQGHNVVVSVIAPYENTRKKIDKICSVFWIYVKGGRKGKETPYEIPKKAYVIVDPSKETLLQSVDKILLKVRNI